MHTYLLIPFLICFVLQPGKTQSLSEATLTQNFVILNESNATTPARVRITDMEGTYHAPVGHTTDFPITFSQDQEALEKDVMLADDRRFAYVDGHFEVMMNSGEPYILEIIKGYLYQRVYDTIQINHAGEAIEIALSRAINPPLEGWYSGDVHVHHINPESALLEMKAEDLNVCNILISDFTKDHDLYKGVIEPISEPEHIIFLGQEYREDKLGHINLLNLTQHLIEPADVMRSHQYPLNIEVAEPVRKQGGHISWAHFAAWPGLEGPLGLILGKVDAVELLCTIDPFQPPIFASEVVPELPLNSGLKLWYRLLNCGLQVPITAGTDKMGNLVTVGANRVYAKVEGPLNYAEWTHALTAGRTFVTNSPIIHFTVDGKEAGTRLNLSEGDSVKITAKVWSLLPVHHLEIIANGELVNSVTLSSNENFAEIEFTFEPKESAWLAARAYRTQTDYLRQGVGMAERRNFSKTNTELNRYFGTLRPEVPFAHTSPIYLHLDEQPIYNKEDVDYFVKYLDNVLTWLIEKGSFPNDEAQEMVIEKFREGRQTFVGLHGK